MGAPLAGTTELQARWRTLTTLEVARADLVIGDLTREAVRRYPDLRDRVAADPDVAADVAEVICNATRRRMTYEEEQPEQGGLTRVDEDPFTSRDLDVLRGPAVASAQAVPLWSNDC